MKSTLFVISRWTMCQNTVLGTVVSHVVSHTSNTFSQSTVACARDSRTWIPISYQFILRVNEYIFVLHMDLMAVVILEILQHAVFSVTLRCPAPP